MQEDVLANIDKEIAAAQSNSDTWHRVAEELQELKQLLLSNPKMARILELAGVFNVVAEEEEAEDN